MKRDKLNFSHWKTILLSSLGGTLEFYDFIIFAVFAVSIGKTFFPATDKLLSLLYAFFAFAIGYFARPIGGILFSHFGDRYSRKTVFLISMVVMALATFLMAILPGFFIWGVTASIIFIILRLLQGIAIGGEIPGAITFVKEHIHTHPGLACGVVFLFINLGIFLADLAYGALNQITSVAYAWRIAFFLGGILAILSYFLRKTLEESPVFKRELARYHIPLFALLRHHKTNLIFGFLIVACQAALNVLLYLYPVSFMNLNNYSHHKIAWISGINLLLFSFACVFWGWLSDYIGQRLLMIVGAVFSIPLAIWFYAAMVSHIHLMGAYAMLAIASSMFTGSFASYLASLFPVNVRFSGVALCFNLAFATFGGLSPLLATYLIKVFHNSLMPSYVFVGACILGILGSFMSRQYIKHSAFK